MLGALEQLFINNVEKQLRQQNKSYIQHQMQQIPDLDYYPTVSRSIKECTSKDSCATQTCSKVVVCCT